MSKKSKKFDAPEGSTNDAPATTEAQVPAEVAAEAKAPAVPRAPSLLIDDGNGVQFKFIRYPLPKRSVGKPGDYTIVVDGVETPVWTTNNKGSSTEGTEVSYNYFKLGEVQGYVVLQNEDIAGLEFTSAEGDAKRANPKSVSKMTDEEKAARIAKALETRAKNKAGTPAATEPVAV